MNDELISRNALLELYENTHELNLDNFNVPVPVVRQNIIDMPAVKAVKLNDLLDHGRWSEVAYFRTTRLTEISPGVWASGTQIGETRYQCSVCKKYENIFEKYGFCPNCGAKMDLEE